MAPLPVAFRSNAGRYNYEGTPALVNCYAEQRGGDAKGPHVAMPCDGSLTFSAVTDTPCRGAIYMDDLNVVYTVHSGAVWKITSGGTATVIGTVPGADRVQMARNQKSTPQIVIKCDAGVYRIQSDAVIQITDPDLPAVISVASLGGYIIYGIADGRFFLSALNEAELIDATDFATAESAADPLRRVYVNGGELYLMGSRTIEPWVLTGQADFPFELRSAASVVQLGLLAADSVADFDNTFAFVGQGGIVYRYANPPQRISDHEVERLITNDANQSSITAFSWVKGGHYFYNVTGTNWSRCYDAATKVWHTRNSYQEDRWRHDHALDAFGKVLVFDRLGGSCFYLDSNTYTEAGATLIYGVDSPPMHNFPNGAIVDALHLDMAAGVGNADASTEAHMMLSWSNDGGNTYSTPRTLSLGRLGQHSKRVTTRRLGRFGPRGRTWRIRISDVTGRSLTNVDAETRALKR